MNVCFKTQDKKQTKQHQVKGNNAHFQCQNGMKNHEETIKDVEAMRIDSRERRRGTNPVYSPSQLTPPPGPTPPRSEVCG